MSRLFIILIEIEVDDSVQITVLHRKKSDCRDVQNVGLLKQFGIIVAT